MGTPLKATMVLPKNGKTLWTDIMQNPTPLPQSITEGQFIVASYAKFSDGVFVFGGVAAGPESQDFNYALFMVFDKNGNQLPDWPIDPSDWEDFYVNEIDFAIDSDEENYSLLVVEEQ